MFLIRACVSLFLFIDILNVESLHINGKFRKWTDNVIGDPCEWEGKNGTCVNFWTCVTNAVDAVVHKKYPPVCNVVDGEVYSCCTGCHLVANISAIVIIHKYGLILERTGSKSYDQCLRYMQENDYPCYHKLSWSKVDKTYSERYQCYTTEDPFGHGGGAAGGVNARRAEYPHMALLGYGEDQESAQWLCGGSVISERFILTAGHCRVAHGGDEVQFVALGILKRSDPPSLWQVYRVDTFIPHPEYKALFKYHDIALIRTDREISFNNAVLPACLPQKNLHTSFASATGWGQLKYRGEVADVLQKVVVQAYEASVCTERYGPSRTLTRGFDNHTQFCYGDNNNGRDTCEGDSGGPLQVDECPHVVFGVTSSGQPCGFPGGAGLYTRVEAYLPWIESIVWP